MKETRKRIVTELPEKQVADVYFDGRYGALYEEKEQASLELFTYCSDYGEIQYRYLKRSVPYLISGEQYYDIITPYGYGGPNIVAAIDAEKLIVEFQKAFAQHCKEQKIVSEFIRFHLLKNKEVVNRFYGEAVFSGLNIVKDLREPILQDCSKSVKRTMKKAQQQGFEVIYDTSGERLDDFLTVYYSTMDRNGANNYYYFDEDFFRRLNQEMEGHYVYVHVLLENKVIATGLTLYGSTYSYGFLGGTLSDYFTYNPTTFLEIKSMEWLKEKQVDYYILGGGYEPDDGIYRFKRSFAKTTGDVPFYIGKKVHDSTIYQQLVQQRSKEPNFDPSNSYFPLYRS